MRGVAGALALGAAVASIGYTAVAVARVLAFARRLERRRIARGRRGASSDPRPSVTILKPVRGLERGLHANLASFCAQDYPAYDVVLGTRDPNDPALPVLHAVARAARAPTTVVNGDGTARFRNPKISTLAPMLPYATGEIVAISDSDMRVEPDYLDAIVAPFANPHVGAVTCLYRGEPATDSLASTLGAMWITEQFVPQALIARDLEPTTYCFGATMAVRRDVLDRIGGLDALGDHLADDHELGRAVAAAGARVVIADYAVAAYVDEESIGALLRHELRWARTIRSLRPAGYVGVALTYPVPLALLAAALARRTGVALAVVASAFALRLAMHASTHALTSPRAHRPALLPLRDALGFAVWCAGLFGSTVRWRDARMALRGTSRPNPPETH